MTLGAKRPTQRLPVLEELRGQQINAGDFFGTTSDHGAQVWHFDGSKAVRVDLSNPDSRSMIVLNSNESLHEALQRIPMFAKTPFTMHKMELPPGAYYPRISRPHDQHPLESLGIQPECKDSSDLLASTLSQVRYLVGILDTIFQSIHPAPENMACYGNSIRNLLILACTECEAQWRGVLVANGVTIKNPTTNQYVKLASAMRLSEYAIKLRHCPWLDPVRPFSDWSATDPTKTIPWYNSYHSTKHDREGEFTKATLGVAIEAVSALWIMVAAQFGINGVLEFDDLSRYFQIAQAPRWRHSEVYINIYIGFEDSAGPRRYPF